MIKKISILFAIIFFLFLFAFADIAATDKNDSIKWIDFEIPYLILQKTVDLDIASWNAVQENTSETHYDFICLLSLLAAKYGGDFKFYKSSDLEDFCKKIDEGIPYEKITSNKKLYNYYIKAYTAVLGGLVGDYVECKTDSVTGETTFTENYGLIAFSPIASGYYYSHFDDFGASRSYGYKRNHLGHDLMGSVGTPVIAIEGGYVEAVGWNPYGGWRIGIRSFDNMRYYYYAHLRKDHPYNDIYEGKIVNAGEVIGYLGMTGYSRIENTNNIDTPHLHFGMQIIFDPSQKDGDNQIWINMYDLTKFLYQNRTEVKKDPLSKEIYSTRYRISINTPD